MLLCSFSCSPQFDFKNCNFYRLNTRQCKMMTMIFAKFTQVLCLKKASTAGCGDCIQREMRLCDCMDPIKKRLKDSTLAIIGKGVLNIPYWPWYFTITKLQIFAGKVNFLLSEFKTHIRRKWFLWSLSHRQIQTVVNNYFIQQRELAQKERQLVCTELRILANYLSI